MQTTVLEQELDEVQQTDSTEYLVAESRVEGDGVDWCVWWAEYGETLE